MDRALKDAAKQYALGNLFPLAFAGSGISSGEDLNVLLTAVDFFGGG